MQNIFSCRCTIFNRWTLQVQGERDDSTRVYFLSDRLIILITVSRKWPGIYFGTESINNVLNSLSLKMLPGIAAEAVTEYKSQGYINECIIDNIYDAGILGANEYPGAELPHQQLREKYCSWVWGQLQFYSLYRCQLFKRLYSA